MALITAGVVILADVAVTLAWQEPTSSLYAAIEQGDADSELLEVEREFPAPADRRVASRSHGEPGQVRALAERFARQIGDGDAIGRLAIPAVDLDLVMVQGTDTADLTKGPGHYPSTPLPGQPGTTAVAGHRTTYLAPFRNLDELGRGDLVEIEMPYATLDYRVETTRVVEPTDLEILDGAGYQRLVLTACHPLYSASQRIAAFARLDRIRSVALGAPGSS